MASVNRENKQEILIARYGATVLPLQAQQLLASPQPEQIANPGHERHQSFLSRHPSSTPHEIPHPDTQTPTLIQSYPISYCLRDDGVGIKVESSSRPMSRKFADPTWGRRRQNPALRSSVHHTSSLQYQFLLIASAARFSYFFFPSFFLSFLLHRISLSRFPHASHIFHRSQSRYPQCG